jgi:hypothetical protein
MYTGNDECIKQRVNREIAGLSNSARQELVTILKQHELAVGSCLYIYREWLDNKDHSTILSVREPEIDY